MRCLLAIAVLATLTALGCGGHTRERRVHVAPGPPTRHVSTQQLDGYEARPVAPGAVHIAPDVPPEAEPAPEPAPELD